MKKEVSNYDEQLKRMSDNDLTAEAIHAHNAFQKLGFSAIDIPGLLFATRYRLQNLIIHKVTNFQKENGRAATEAEREAISAQVEQENPRYSGPMLTETLRYQLGRDYQGDTKLENASIPQEENGDYGQVVAVLERLGKVIHELQVRKPNSALKDILPQAFIRDYAAE